jgi:hypothetical protein
MPVGRPKGIPKTGGRQKGSKNKITLDVAQKLAAWSFDPFRGMFELATDSNNSPEVRLRACSELAQYVAPKRKAVEHSGPDGSAVQHEHLHVIDLNKLTPEELEAAEKLGASTARVKAGAGDSS